MADWLSLTVPAAAALAGVGLTQFAAARQAKARADREDAARSWEHRREVYSRFTEALFSLYTHVDPAGPDFRDSEDKVRVEAYSILPKLQMFGTAEAYELGRAAYRTGLALRRGEKVKFAPLTGFLAQARKDLKVPD